jgi:hypothetical protein
MSSLQTRVEDQFQLCLEFLGPNDVVLKNGNLPIIVEHVKNVSSSLRVYLQQIRFKKKVEQVKEQKLGLKVNMQKVKAEQVEEQKLRLKVEQVEEQKLRLKVDL